MKLLDISPWSKGTIFTQVDDEDFDFLNQWKWCAHTTRHNRTYVDRRDVRSNKSIFLHKEIMKPPTGLVVDHIDGNPLNNQKQNLRVCTRSENIRNRVKKTAKSISRYKGVSIVKGKFQVTIHKDKKSIHLGRFEKEIDAAKAYNVGALKYHGEFACLNIINVDTGLGIRLPDLDPMKARI